MYDCHPDRGLYLGSGVYDCHPDHGLCLVCVVVGLCGSSVWSSLSSVPLTVGRCAYGSAGQGSRAWLGSEQTLDFQYCPDSGVQLAGTSFGDH